MIRAKIAATTPAVRKLSINGVPHPHKNRVVIAPIPKKAACPKLICPVKPARIFQLWDSVINKKIKISKLIKSFLLVNRGIRARIAIAAILE